MEKIVFQILVGISLVLVFRFFYLIICLNYYNVHYVNVVYTSENMHVK